MRWLAELPLRIVMIPVFLVMLAMMAVTIPFVCLFGTITYKNGKPVMPAKFKL